MIVESIQLEEKSGGASGDWQREDRSSLTPEESSRG